LMSSFLRSSSSRSSSVIILDFDCMHPISCPFSVSDNGVMLSYFNWVFNCLPADYYVSILWQRVYMQDARSLERFISRQCSLCRKESLRHVACCPGHFQTTFRILLKCHMHLI
jgi:hypothetical protein